MRKFSYWLCFCLVAVPPVFGLLGWLLSLVGVALPGITLLAMAASFGSLVPRVLQHFVPQFLSIVLGYVMLTLVVRRLWLLLAKRQGVPHSYVGVPKTLGYAGAWLFILAAVVLLLAVVLRAGSGVPAGMLLVPAALCVPWAFFLTEALSLRGEKPQ